MEKIRTHFRQSFWPLGATLVLCKRNDLVPSSPSSAPHPTPPPVLTNSDSSEVEGKDERILTLLFKILYYCFQLQECNFERSLVDREPYGIWRIFLTVRLCNNLVMLCLNHHIHRNRYLLQLLSAALSLQLTASYWVCKASRLRL